MARRRGRKEPSGVEVIAMMIAGALVLANFSGVTKSEIIGFVFWAIAIIVFAALAVWFIRGLIDSSEPIGSKQRQSNAARRSQLGYDRHPERSEGSNKNATYNAESAHPTVPVEQAPKKWTKQLIADLEWRVFEKLCTRLWEEKGFDARETNSGADGCVDFYLYAKQTNKKIGAVQCKSWNNKQIGVNVLRELQGVVASEQLKLGLLMYSGSLSKAAHEFLSNPAVSVKTRSSAEILTEIKKLTTAQQDKLLLELTIGDYKTPTCPNCDVKLVERTAKKTGRVFWGCSNFPRCRHVLN